MIPREFYSTLDRERISYIKDLPLSRYSSFRIGGEGEIGIFPKDKSELIFCLSEAKKYSLPCRILGKGSNILFGDGYIDGVFIFTEKLCNIEINGTCIYAEAGATLASVSAKAAEAGLSGLEFARGIPGSVGGAVFMNAGAYGGQMSDIITRTEAVSQASGDLLRITGHAFSYRESIYTHTPELVCLSAKLKLSRGNTDEINEKMCALAEQRRQKQPLDTPSCGSYFKRPTGHFAGKLIEDCGLKGLRVGNAAVSEKHAGFIVNLGGATAHDVLELEKAVIDTVFKKFGVMLEREVRVIQ